ncbi:hypothetical protein ACEPAI_10091 [Sanghuangporus weigelae]
MPMPAPILLSTFNSINFPLYTTADQHYALAYPCPQSPPGLMPPKSVSIFTPADALDEDDDDDLPPLVEAPPATFAEPEDAQNDTDVDREENAGTTGAGSDANAQGAQIGGGGMQYTFASTITPSTFSASSPSASPGPVQAGHAFDAPSSASPGLPSYPPGFHAHRQFHAHSPTGAGFGSGMGAGAGADRMGASAGVGVGIEPPSPSNADVGSPSPPTAPSPSFGPDSTTTSATSPSLSLALDEQREPSSGPFRLGIQAQGGGGRTKPLRPPSYIPRPPNAFILFRASFVRSQRLDAQSSAGGAAGVTTGGVSALGPGSVITIEPSSSPSLLASGKRGGKAGSELSGLGGGGGGPTTPSTSLSKLAGQLWRALPAAERAVWESRARAAQAEHRAKYPDWRFRPENASGPGSGGAFWTGGGGGGSTMGSVPWSASAAMGGGGGGDDWGGAVATGKYRGGGSGKDGGGGGGGGEGSRRRKDRDRDKEREKDREREGGGGKGKDKTGVGTSTSASADTNPDASPGPGPGLGASPSLKSSPTATRRGRTRNSRAATRTSTSTSALALPSWAITGLEIEEDDNACANKDRHPSTITSTSAAMARQSSTNTEGSPRSEVVKTSGEAGPKDIEQSQNQEARKDASGSAGAQDAGTTQIQVQGSVASLEAAHKSRIPSPARPASQVQENKDQADQDGKKSRETKKNKEAQNLASAASTSEHDQTQEKTERNRERGRERGSGSGSGSDVRFAAVPLTDIARRSVSVEASQESAGERGSRSAVPSPLPVSSGPVADSIVAPAIRTSTATFNESQESTNASTSTGSSQAQGQDLASEFELGRAFFTGSASQQRRDSLVSLSGSASGSGGSGSGSVSGSASASAAGAGIGISTPHQHTRSHSFSQAQTQARAQHVPMHIQTQAPVQARISSVIPAAQNRIPLPSRGANVVSRGGGPVRTGRRNTVTVAGLSGATSASPASARQFGVRFHDARAGVGSVSPVSGPGAGPGTVHYGFGPVYPAFERGLEEQQSSPPPLSPALSSPLSAATSSPTYAGHGSPFSATGQFSPPLHRPHPYAHARAQSFHQQVLHHAQMHGHGQSQAQSTISPMMLPMQTHAQSEAAFMSPVSSPSFYSHAAAAHVQSREHGSPGGVNVRMDINVNANMDMDVDVASQHTASSAGTAASASSSSSTTVTSLFPPSSASVSAGGGTAPSSDAGASTGAVSTQVPLPHLSSYSSLTGWAGTASPFTPRPGPGSGMSESPGAGVYETVGFAADETSSSAFPSPMYAYPPYSDMESGAWHAYDLVGQGMSGGSSMEDRYAPSISAGGEMDGIAFGPGPNSTSTPSPIEGPFTSQCQNSQQQQGLFTPHTPGPSQCASQSQSTSVFSPPLSHSVAHTPLQYPYGESSPSPGSVPSPFHGTSHPSNVGGGFAQGYITRHPMHVHESPGEPVPASGIGGGGNVTYVLDRYPSGSSLTGGGLGGSPYQRTKERRR